MARTWLISNSSCGHARAGSPINRAHGLDIPPDVDLSPPKINEEDIGGRARRGCPLSIIRLASII